MNKAFSLEFDSFDLKYMQAVLVGWARVRLYLIVIVVVLDMVAEVGIHTWMVIILRVVLLMEMLICHVNLAVEVEIIVCLVQLLVVVSLVSSRRIMKFYAYVSLFVILHYPLSSLFLNV